MTIQSERLQYNECYIIKSLTDTTTFLLNQDIQIIERKNIYELNLTNFNENDLFHRFRIWILLKVNNTINKLNNYNIILFDKIKEN